MSTALVERKETGKFQRRKSCPDDIYSLVSTTTKTTKSGRRSSNRRGSKMGEMVAPKKNSKTFQYPGKLEETTAITNTGVDNSCKSIEQAEESDDELRNYLSTLDPLRYNSPGADYEDDDDNGSHGSMSLHSEEDARGCRSEKTGEKRGSFAKKLVKSLSPGKMKKRRSLGSQKSKLDRLRVLHQAFWDSYNWEEDRELTREQRKAYEEFRFQ